MNQKESKVLADKKPVDQTKNVSLSPKINALLIGVMIGIIIFSVVKSTVGFFTLIPLFFIYKLVNRPQDDPT